MLKKKKLKPNCYDYIIWFIVHLSGDTYKLQGIHLWNYLIHSHFKFGRTQADLVHSLTLKTLNQMCSNWSRVPFPKHVLSSCWTAHFRDRSAERLLNYTVKENAHKEELHLCQKQNPRQPQRSYTAVKHLISLFCQTSESIISHTNGLNYDQMSWVTCCHETPWVLFSQVSTCVTQCEAVSPGSIWWLVQARV